MLFYTGQYSENIVVAISQCKQGNQVQKVTVLFSVVKQVTSRLVIRLKLVKTGSDYS